MALDLSKAKAQEKKLLQKIAKDRSDLARLQKQQKEAARKADSRRKIVLGAVVLAAVRKGGISEKSVRGLVDRYASDKDKKAFEDFAFETGEVVVPPEASVLESITTNAESHAPGE